MALVSFANHLCIYINPSDILIIGWCRLPYLILLLFLGRMNAEQTATKKNFMYTLRRRRRRRQKHLHIANVMDSHISNISLLGIYNIYNIQIHKKKSQTQLFPILRIVFLP